MAVGVTVGAVSGAERMASRTMEMSVISSLFESTRHHPELLKEAGQDIKMSALLLRWLQNSGMDMEAVKYTPEEKQQRAKQQEQARKQALAEQMQMAQQIEQTKIQGKAAAEPARSAGQKDLQLTKIAAEQKVAREQSLADILAQHEARMKELQAGVAQEVGAMGVGA